MTDSNIAGIAEADFGKAGVSFDNDRPILVDSSDFLFYAALAMLPIDGTVAGPYMPFWTPLSPWLFMAYAVANWRLLPQIWHRFRAFFLFPVLLIALSAVDWYLVAFHRFRRWCRWPAWLGLSPACVRWTWHYVSSACLGGACWIC